MYKKVVLIALCALSLGLSAPVSTEAGGLAGVIAAGVQGAQQYKQVTKEIDMIDTVYRNEYCEKIKGEVGVNYEWQANQQLNNIFARLNPIVAKYDPTVYERPYNYFVNNETSFNAFCTMGHNFSVNIGAFNALNYQEDEMAFVVGHELSHGTHNHVLNGAKKSIGMQTALAMVAAGGNLTGSIMTNFASNYAQAKWVTLPQEKVADKDSFTYCSEAGYNVGAGAAVWQRVLDHSTKATGNMLALNDHPKTENRRDTNSDYMTEYSNKMVVVDKKTGEIFVNKVKIGVANAGNGQSARERTYFVAGNLAKVYHANAAARPEPYIYNGGLYLGDYYIMSLAYGDNGSAWVNNLKLANKGK